MDWVILCSPDKPMKCPEKPLGSMGLWATPISWWVSKISQWNCGIGLDDEVLAEPQPMETWNASYFSFFYYEWRSKVWNTNNIHETYVVSVTNAGSDNLREKMYNFLDKFKWYKSLANRYAPYLYLLLIKLT